MSFQRAEQPVVLQGTKAARAFLAPCVTGERRGDWWVAHVDERVRCIHLASYPPARRCEDSGFLPASAILGDAAQLGSAGVLIGSWAPLDRADGLTSQLAATRELLAAAEAIDVTVLDHLVFDAGECVSLRRAGLI